MSSEESETRKKILEATWNLMEQRQGHGVRMSDIAARAGVSRQALYLHFASRTDLLVATTQYGDQVRNLEARLKSWHAATRGVDVLNAYVEFWGNYIPEIYGIARALLAVRDTDEAAAAAWDERMAAVREGCRRSIRAVQRDGMLGAEWTLDTATDFFWTMLSIRNWEQLTIECGWPNDQYVHWLQKLVYRIFVREDVQR